MVWNSLDYPGLVIPVARVDPQVDIKRTRHDFFGEFDRRMHDFCMSLPSFPCVDI